MNAVVENKPDPVAIKEAHRRKRTAEEIAETSDAIDIDVSQCTTENFGTTLGSRLRWLRDKNGLNQRELADASRVDTTPTVVQKIENGKSLKPRRIDCFAAYFKVDVRWLMFGPVVLPEEDPGTLELAKKLRALMDVDSQNYQTLIDCLEQLTEIDDNPRSAVLGILSKALDNIER